MRLKIMALISALMVVIAACGGGGNGAEPVDSAPGQSAGPEDPADDDAPPDESAQAPPPSGSGEVTIDGETFQVTEVHRCEPFDFYDENNPNDLDVAVGTDGGGYLSLVISNATGYSGTGGSESYEQQTHELRINRSDDSGQVQFVAAASHDIDGVWYLPFLSSFGQPQEGEMLGGPPFTRDGDSISGGMVVTKDYPVEDGATLDVTFDFEFPSEITGC